MLSVVEFQTIEKLTSLENILSEAAKFDLLLCLAHQNLGQLTRKGLQNSILGNMGTVISFRIGPKDAFVLTRVFGKDVGIDTLVNMAPLYDDKTRSGKR